jgi:DNA-binding NarL/FixJ family response regulator
MNLSILIADDHTIVREGLRLLLETQPGFRVVGEAADGREALQKALKLCPDIVLMDIAMPEFNGIDATRQIRKTCSATRVIILSMHASREHVYRAFQAGASAYLLKESAGREVIQAVQAVFEGHRYLSQPLTDVLLDDISQFHKPWEYQDPLDCLSGREREVLQLIVEGRSSAEIADRLYLSVKTAETYRSRLMQKLGIHDIPGLVKFAIQHGVTTIDP